MSDLGRFMKKNKVVKEHIKLVATRSLTDEEGKPLLWEIKPLTTKEDSVIRDECTVDIPVTGKPGMYRPKFNSSRYLEKMAARSVVSPNLDSKELQDSYGVMCAEDLVKEMIDDPGEYNVFMTRLQEYHGFTEAFQDKVDEAKN